MAANPNVNILDANSPGLDFTPGVTKRRRWDGGTGGPGPLASTITDYTLTAESGPEGYLLFTASAATVRIPQHKVVPFKTDMQISCCTDAQNKTLTLTPNFGVRVIVDDDPLLKALAIDTRSFRFTGTSNGFSIRNLGRDLWLLMRGDRPILEYAGDVSRVLANTADGLPMFWPRD